MTTYWTRLLASEAASSRTPSASTSRKRPRASGCWRSSTSSQDMRGSADEHLLLLERRPERMQLPHGLDHRHDAAGERPVRGSRGAVANLDRDRAERGLAVAVAGRRDRVGDERDAALRRAPHEHGGLVGHVMSVQDDLNDDVVVHERRDCDSRIAVPERPHRVEGMGDGGGTARECGPRLVGGRVRVPARDDHAAEPQQVDQLEGALKLGRKRHLRDGPRLEQPLEQLGIGVAPELERVRPDPPGREEGALEVHSHDARAERELRNLPERCDQRLFRRGDQRRLVCRHAGLQERLAGDVVVGGRRVEEVDAAEAVDLQVDKAGNRDPATRPGEPTAHDASVDHVYITRDDLAPDDRRFDADPHGAPLRARRTTPPASWSRSRADDASRPSSSETIATFTSPPAASRAPSTCSSVAPVARETIRRARSLSFSFVAQTSTIRFPNVRPSRTIATVEIVLRTSFCAVPAFIRVDPAITSGPTTMRISCSTADPSGESGTQTMPAVTAPAAAARSTAPRTYGVRPLADSATTASSAPIPIASMSASPPSRSSSAASCAVATASTPPATTAITWSAAENVGPHSAASTAASRPDEPAPT